MTSASKRLAFGRLLPAVVIAILAHPVMGSDHADPIMLRKHLEAGITGLFVFPKDDQLVVILGVRRALTTSPPYDLEPFTYTVSMDLHSQVAFDNDQDLARYGGTVINPEGIAADATIEFRLNDDTTLREMQIKGLSDSEAIRVWTGVRDDPFIFPRFFGTNIVALVLSIPISSFPEGQQDWLIWGTSRRGDKQIDHVGRSNRTMLPRLDRLNKLPPNKHVAALTCAQGDCLLWELSFADSKDWPRKTTNDKPFLDNFPYLAEPWPDKEPAPMPGLTTKNKVLLVILVTLIVLLLVVPWVLYIRCRRGVHAAEPT